MADPISPPSSGTVKPGIKSTEGILTILGVLVGLVGQHQGSIPEPCFFFNDTATTEIYTICRTFLKSA